ncbi:ACP S-malonyltransferase [Helicobacter saguini]|uniref:ACP S-malonyltransferase n=1 Tax=Helicobacter saguini TaxID=1548018 RepID=UPI001371FFFA|nr:ACP S-malonyltransferase [Helicobacter saguini]MWV73103.1 ACP S-malonyltransferase [Helicobacter saguini]
MSKLAFIYPGQGSQSVGMGSEFVANFKVARELVERASDALGQDFNKILNDETLLNQTKFTQPAILLVSAMAQSVAQSEFGLECALAFGHSLGEVSSYCLNGGASFEDAIILTHKRGELMQETCDKSGSEVGMLVSLGLDSNVVAKLCEESRTKGGKVWAANFNLNTQIVVGGVKADLESLAVALKEAGAKRAMLLKMSIASHCPLLSDAVKPFGELLESKIKDCDVDVISNATLALYRLKSDALVNLTKQIVEPVLWEKCVLKAVDVGVEKFIEFGNGNVLAGLNNKITNIETISVNSIESLNKLK